MTEKYYDVSVFSDVGCREVNEDAVGVFERGNEACFVLCDGLGGHGMGEVASALVRDVFGSRFAEGHDPAGFLADTFAAAEDILTAEQAYRGAGQRMRTTAVAGILDGKKLRFGHVGDSRLYVFADNRVLTRTLDHSIPQMLVLAGDLDESEIRCHPQRSYVLRVLGVPWEEPMYELRKPLPLKKCQAILLCSDGFWELITEEEMCRALAASRSVGEWMDLMAAAVRENGAGKNMDNNSAIAVWVKKT